MFADAVNTDHNDIFFRLASEKLTNPSVFTAMTFESGLVFSFNAVQV